MSKVKWVKWKNSAGVQYMGSNKYNPPDPWGPWTKIIGVVARCEGNHDTVVSYDETGVTFGFLCWTFTSGRLQKLLQSFKSIPILDLATGEPMDTTLFEEICENKYGTQVFQKYGFRIEGGKFVEAATGKKLNPARKAQRQRIVDICMGRTKYKTFKEQKAHAIGLAKEFIRMGQDPIAAEAQIAFAKHELKQGLGIKRKPLGKYETIANLLDGTWDTSAPALFYNLATNSPGAAYRMFMNVRNTGATGEDVFDLAWKKVNWSKFGNWGWGKKTNKQPRVVRIKKAMKEFYRIDLPYYK